jgi:hypothetical protein
MKRVCGSIRVWMVTALLTALATRVSKGDGGVVLLREARDPFLVTAFVSLERLNGGLADVSVLVQWRKNGEVVLDANVSLTVEPPNGLAVDRAEQFCGPSSAASAFQLSDMNQGQGPVSATRQQASNKLLYAAALKLNAVGDWPLHIYVMRGSDSARFDCLLPVAQKSSKSSGLWPYFLLPPIVITAFALNQRLRRDSLENGVSPKRHPGIF